eukprot:maker-scaffold119_size336447-snap-gene-1.13 protein:Tk11781 transcript:maker-scaffold119_size336447-snap-gene-1.13-mRNA-1 annotation:"cuticle protein"
MKLFTTLILTLLASSLLVSADDSPRRRGRLVRVVRNRRGRGNKFGTRVAGVPQGAAPQNIQIEEVPAGTFSLAEVRSAGGSYGAPVVPASPTPVQAARGSYGAPEPVQAARGSYGGPEPVQAAAVRQPAPATAQSARGSYGAPEPVQPAAISQPAPAPTQSARGSYGAPEPAQTFAIRQPAPAPAQPARGSYGAPQPAQVAQPAPAPAQRANEAYGAPRPVASVITRAEPARQAYGAPQAAEQIDASDAVSVQAARSGYGSPAAPQQRSNSVASEYTQSRAQPAQKSFSGAQVAAGSSQSVVRQSTEKPVAILRSSYNAPGTEGFERSYDFSFESENGIVQESSGELRTVNNTEVMVMRGSYSYTGNDGRDYLVSWVADENGYRAEADFLPLAPEIPFPEQAEAVAAQIRFAQEERTAESASQGRLAQATYE